MMLRKLGKRIVLRGIIKSKIFVVVFLIGCGLSVQAQTAGGNSSAPQTPAQPATVPQSPTTPTTPQVVTVVHRLNGLKVLSLLHRGGQSPMVVGDEFVTTRDMLTSVTAGFVLGDGKSVLARLPQAEAEIEFNFNWPQMPALPAPFTPGAMPSTPSAPAAPTFNFQTPPELQVIQRDGRTRAAKYIGLDASTGLSLLQIEGLGSTPLRDATEETLNAGQRVRLLAPQRINATAQSSNGGAAISAQGNLYLAVSEIEGRITELKRSANGKLAHLLVRAPKLSSAFAGGVALSEAGETIGIVETSDADEARVMPMALVRRAAERVLARRGNVPQPWLGVRGQALAATPLAQLLSRGWTEEEAALLQAKRNGILLTAVAPNTPAALANLQSGDVIVKLNEDEVKSVDDFSFMLNEAGSGATVSFTVLRKGKDGARSEMRMFPKPATAAPPSMRFELLKPWVVNVRLSESLNAARWNWETKTRTRSAADPFAAAGIESIPLSSKAAARLGAQGGLLVVFVGPESAAARAGLRAFDVIESVNGQPVSTSNASSFFNTNDSQPKNLIVIRNRQKFSFSFSFSAGDAKKP
jgi:S1-C subfamily serine protease